MAASTSGGHTFHCGRGWVTILTRPWKSQRSRVARTFFWRTMRIMA
jgi:hypothetical protein